LIYSQLAQAPFADRLDHSPTSVQAGIFIGLSVALGLFLNALSTPLYRFLEGYSWPAKFQTRGVQRQRNIKRLIEEARTGEGWLLGLNLEQLSRFPLDDAEIAPSRLGNALRAFETYGATRFSLDSQVLWNELCTAVPRY